VQRMGIVAFLHKCCVTGGILFFSYLCAVPCGSAEGKCLSSEFVFIFCYNLQLFSIFNYLHSAFALPGLVILIHFSVVC
jgi:hypothetical protein